MAIPLTLRASIWPIDILREVHIPVSVDAVDISMAQFPPASWLPENIRLLTHDVYQPFPDHMHGTYDLVNVQNWLCIWKTETSGGLIRNLLDLLSKYLQRARLGYINSMLVQSEILLLTLRYAVVQNPVVMYSGANGIRPLTGSWLLLASRP